MTYPEWTTVFFLFLLLCAFAFAMLYQPRVKKARRISRTNDFGWAMVHLNRSMRSHGMEPSVIDLRYISQKEWQPFTNVIPLGGNEFNGRNGNGYQPLRETWPQGLDNPPPRKP